MSANPCLVFDQGSYMSKLGFATESGSESKILQPTIIAKAKSHNKIITSNLPFIYGNKARALEGLFDITYPIQSKFEVNWNELEELWSHFFSDDLMIPISDCNVLITEEDLNPKLNKKKITQMMFEKFQVKGLFIVNPSVLSLFSIGKAKGIVIDSGDLSTSFVPIKYSAAIKNAMTKSNIAGKCITEQLIKLLNNPIVNHRGIGDRVKEAACYCSLDIAQEEMKPFEYELPDGNVISIGDQQFKATEILFSNQSNGNGNGNRDKGIQSELYQAMMNVSKEIEADSEYPLLLVGGTTLLKGFKERLQQEISSLLPIELKYNFRLVETADKLLSTWIGGVYYSFTIDTASKWVTRDMYQEKGLNAIYDSFN